jgi:hypothetical protein
MDMKLGHPHGGGGEERRLRDFDSRVMKRIVRPTRDNVTGEWTGLNNEELNGVYSSPKLFGFSTKKNEMGWACSNFGEKESCM